MVKAGHLAETATLTSELKVSVQTDEPANFPFYTNVEEGVRKESVHEVDFHVTGEAASHYPAKLTPKDERTLQQGLISSGNFKETKSRFLHTC